MKWYEWLFTISAIGIIEAFNFAGISSAFKARERDRMKHLNEWAKAEADRMFTERLHNTRWQVLANVELVNESDIDWGDSPKKEDKK